MSPREAVARALAPQPRPGAEPDSRRPRLTVVPRGTVRPPRAPFVLLVGGLLVAGLAGLLWLNTTLAQGSFRLQALQQRSTALDDQEQALSQAVALEATPQRLAARATALGMVPSPNPVFLRLSDGSILGKAAPGPAATRPAAKPAGGGARTGSSGRSGR